MSEFTTPDDERLHLGRQLYVGISLILDDAELVDSDRQVCDLVFNRQTTLRLARTPPTSERSAPVIDLDFYYGRPKAAPSEMIESIDNYKITSTGDVFRRFELRDLADTALLHDELKDLIERQRADSLDDRRHAMRRCIGPIIIANVLSGLDNLAAQPASDEAMIADLARSSMPVKDWLKPTRDFGTISEAVAALSDILQARVSFDAGIDKAIYLTADPRLATLNKRQAEIFNKFTYGGRDLEANISDTVPAQADIVASIMLPAFLAAKHGWCSPAELLAGLNRLPLEEVAVAMEDAEFVKALSVLPMAPNGTLANTVDKANLGFSTTALEEDEYYSPDSGRVNLITKVFSNYDLFINRVGQVVLNPDYARQARESIRLDNKTDVNIDGLTPTIGCPAMLERATLYESDLTDEQVAALHELDGIDIKKPNGHYRLTFERSVIIELHKQHVQALRWFMDLKPEQLERSDA